MEMEGRCPYCNRTSLESIIVVKEQGIGLNEKFRYRICESCGSLILIDIPVSLDRYYPSGLYYSLKDEEYHPSPIDKLLSAVRKVINDVSFRGHGILYSLLEMYELQNRSLYCVGHLNPTRSSRILEVGCGEGGTLKYLKSIGYEKLMGIDPFIKQDVTNPLTIKKLKFEDFDSGGVRFDTILFIHSLEHLNNPRDALTKANGMLSPDGTIVIGIPIVADAFRIYRENWYGIAAPRHLSVPTLKGLLSLAYNCGLTTDELYYDSDSEQFLISEKYKNGEMNSFKKSLLKRTFMLLSTRSRKYRKLARASNHDGSGDKITIYLKKLRG